MLPGIKFLTVEQMVGAEFAGLFLALEKPVALVPFDLVQIQLAFSEGIDVEHVICLRIADVDERIRFIDDDGFGQALVVRGVVAVF